MRFLLKRLFAALIQNFYRGSTIKGILLILLMIGGITCSERVVKTEVQGASYCASVRFEKIFTYPSQEKIKEILNNDDLKKYSKKSIDLSIAYGFWESLIEYEALRKKDPKNPLVYDYENKVLHGIYFALSDIEATESEIKCYDDRFSEIIFFLKEKEDDIVQSNSFKAILVGGLGTLLDGASASNTQLNQAIVLTSGLLITYFSYLAFDPLVVANFTPKSTMLKDIWNNPNVSQSYSYPIWYLLRSENSEQVPKISPRNLLIKRWEENSFLGKEPKEREKLINLYFGTGGESSIKVINNRKEMLMEVMVTLGLLKQTVRNFQSELIYREDK